MRPGVSVLVGLGYAWLATGLRPFTLPALGATLGAGLVALAVGATRPPRPAPYGRRSGRRSAPWVTLALAGAAWELQSFLQHPRRGHPTVSSLTNELLENHPVRAVALLAWLAAGVWLARR